MSTDMETDNNIGGGGGGYNDDDSSAPLVGPVMTEQAQQERRNSIRSIMADETLTPLEKRRNIQSLMDGRRRSSMGSTGSYSSMDNVRRRSSMGSTGSFSSQGEMATAATESSECYQSDIDDNYNNNVSMADDEYYGYHDYNSSGGQHQHPHQHQQQPSQQQQNQHQTNEQLLQSMASAQAGARKQRSSSMPLWSEDTSRAAAPLVAASSNAIWDDPINVSRRMEKSRPACSHYERNCTIISPCCGLAFGCRICHDECPVLPMPFARRPQQFAASPQQQASTAGAAAAAADGVSGGVQQERILNWDAVEKAKHKQEKRRSMPLSYDDYVGEETHHEIDRFSIAEVICRLCYVRQSSKT
jgi:hypothetical protein